MASNFKGYTDKYMHRLDRGRELATVSDLDDNDAAVQMKRLSHIRAANYSEEYLESAQLRTQQYQSYARYYTGNHFIHPVYEGFHKVTVNFCQMVVDKTVEWVVANGFSVSHKDGRSVQLGEILNQVWEDNDKEHLHTKLTLESCMKGDAYLYVNMVDTDESGRRLPKSEWRIKLNFLPADYCYPIYREDMPENPVAVLVSYPILMKESQTGEPVRAQFGMYATAEKIIFMTDGSVVETVANPLGEVPIVHFPNTISATSRFGVSEVAKIHPLNEKYNETMSTLSKIIEYTGEPTTIVKGAKLSTLERGANKVWSNLPTDGDVFNLELESELEPIQNFLTRIEDNIFRMAETPKIAFDTQDDGYSNTSGIAMQMLFQPLVEKTRRIRKAQQKSFKTTNRLILKCLKKINGIDIESLLVDSTNPKRVYDTKVKFTSLLPKDENEELDRVIKKLDAGILSKAEAIRQVSGVDDYEQHSLELLSDKIAKLVEAFELQKGAMGIQPALSSAGIGSDCLTEEVRKVLSNIEDTVNKLSSGKNR